MPARIANAEHQSPPILTAVVFKTDFQDQCGRAKASKNRHIDSDRIYKHARVSGIQQRLQGHSTAIILT